MIKSKLFTLLILLSLPVFCGAQNAWLGIVFKDTKSIPAEYNPSKGSMALEIEKVVPGSGAIEAALQKGDLILGVGHSRLTNRRVLIRAVKSKKVGEKVLLLIGRDNKIFEQAVELKSRPADVSALTGTAMGSAKPYRGEVYANEEGLQDKPKIVLLDFWATWCGPCRITSPMLDRLFKKYRKQGLEVVGISKEGKEKLLAFQKQDPVSYPLFRDATGKISSTYGIKQIPTLFLLDEDGYILRVFYGVPNEESLGKTIEEMLR